MDKYNKHKEICNELNQIYRAKNHDYGDSFGDTLKDLANYAIMTLIELESDAI